MTRKIASAARRVARPDTEVIAIDSPSEPASIQGYYDGAICLAGLLEQVGRHADIDGVVIACFDDTGLDAARCLMKVPVVGIGASAYCAASMIGTRFSVITTLSRSVPVLEANLARYGYERQCAGVIATDIPVLELECLDPKTMDRIRSAIRHAIETHGSDTIVLGCAGMTDLVTQLKTEFGLPVIDGLSCAVAFAEALVSAQLCTSKIGAYAFPVTETGG